MYRVISEYMEEGERRVDIDTAETLTEARELKEFIQLSFNECEDSCLMSIKIEGVE